MKRKTHNFIVTLLLVTVVLLYSLIPLAVKSASNKTFMLPEVIEVVDGDTIKVILPPLKYYPPLGVVKIRINAIDTPETTWRALCDKEKELGLQAKKLLTELIQNRKRIKIINYDYGKYAGRILADVYVGRINIAKWLIKNGLAKEYHGKGPKPNWCQ